MVGNTMAVVVGVVALLVAVCTAVPVARLDRIENDIAAIAQLLRNVAPNQNTAQDVDSPQAAPEITAAKTQMPESVQHVVAVQHPEKTSAQAEFPILKAQEGIAQADISANPLEVTVNMFPTEMFQPDTHAHPSTKPTRMRVLGHPAPMPEKTVDNGARHRWSRDAVTCPGFPHECNNNGMCDNGVCMCDPTHTGPDCSLLRCIPPCSENGLCMNGTCSCTPGWIGATCETVTCYPACGEHGQCIEGKCECMPGFWGASCEDVMCAGKPQCSGHLHGECDQNTGVCKCLDSWGGDDCSKPVYSCAYECLNGGACKNGTCACAPHYEGIDCGVLTPPQYACEGGAVWTTTTSTVVRTCDNLDQIEALHPHPTKATPKCSCPEVAPIWDTATRQCVEEEFCRVGVCGPMDSPSSKEVSLAVRSKPTCEWSQKPGTGTCPGCVAAHEGLTVCFKVGHEVAEQMLVAQEVWLLALRQGGPCPGQSVPRVGTTIHTLLNTTTRTSSNETEIEDDNSATFEATTVTVTVKPNLEGLPAIQLLDTDRRSVLSKTIPVSCTGKYDVYLVIVDNVNKGTAFGDCGVVAENATCPGSPACSGHGTCRASFDSARCNCNADYVGDDCSVQVTTSGNNTVAHLPHNISTVLPIPPDATIVTTDTSVVVSHDNRTYEFFPNGTTVITSNNSVVVVDNQQTNAHGCPANTIWSTCSSGCFPTCRNPNPRCMPTCLSGACQCPQEMPLWDDIQERCVELSRCASQVPCPGIGAVCSNKGICANGTCQCSEGFSGDDCSVYRDQLNRVTTKSGSVQSVTPCSFPFEFRGRTYHDCTTDFDSDGKEWCSVTKEWEQRWGYCAARGACPENKGMVCNGRGECVDGQCVCEPTFSGVDCTDAYIRYNNATFETCELPFLGPSNEEFADCIPGRPVVENGALVRSDPAPEGVSWCLTTFRYLGPESIGYCQPVGMCGNCSLEGGVCDPNGSGRCKCKPGYTDFFCNKKLTEREILIKLFVDTNGYEWNRRSGWGEAGSPCDYPGWAGVTCKNGHVVRLSLDSVGLAGTIPSDLSALPALEVIDFSNNKLVGTFPDVLLHMPTTLRSISVSGNSLVGAVPIIPPRIVYADFSQNYLKAAPEMSDPNVVERVTDGTGTVPRLTPCVFPFEFQGKNFSSCTTEWSSSGRPWCSTTPAYEGLWGGCSDVGTCPGQNEKECSGNGECEVARSDNGIGGGACRCNPGYTSKDCSKRIVRVTRSTYNGVEASAGKTPCQLPFEYNGKKYFDCTTDDSQSGAEWCLLTDEWERKWGFCAPRGTCPGNPEPCSGHGTCADSKCTCDDGWIWNDCSQKQPRVTVGKRQSVGSLCHFPFEIQGQVFNDCAEHDLFGGSVICSVEAGDVTVHGHWDYCAPRGTCPGNPQCSGNGYCVDGECICNTGFQGTDCGVPLSQHDILVKLFRSTNGVKWSDHLGWEVLGHVCDWSGVACDDQGSVTALKLRGNNLDGTLPAELGMLGSLEILDVSENHLAGTVPSTLAHHPKLRLLSLSRNQLVGDLPSGITAQIDCDGTCIQSDSCAKGSCTFPF